MSEPSSEAKDAGVRCNRHAAAIEHGDNDETSYAAIIQQAIDTATVKLRDANDNLFTLKQRAVDRNKRLRAALGQIKEGASGNRGRCMDCDSIAEIAIKALSPEAAQQQQ